VQTLMLLSSLWTADFITQHERYLEPSIFSSGSLAFSYFDKWKRSVIFNLELQTILYNFTKSLSILG
jgi:hypothetical protein